MAVQVVSGMDHEMEVIAFEEAGLVEPFGGREMASKWEKYIEDRQRLFYGFTSWKCISMKC